MKEVYNIKYKKKEDKIGEVRLNKHGTPMKLINYNNVYDCTVQFQDEYGYTFEHAVYNNFLQGKIANPYDKTVYGMGMLGVGKYKARYTGEKFMSVDYGCWRDILSRCYVHEEVFPAYYNITTICDEWLNFQNFAKWYEENTYPLPNSERLHLDKDILIPMNKCYSPETCMFVPQSINMLFSNMARKDGLPNGIQRTTNGEKFMAMYNKEHLGCYNTIEEAYEKYATKKELAIKDKAEEYKKYIPQKVYEALLSYKVKIEYDKNYKQ